MYDVDDRGRSQYTSPRVDLYDIAASETEYVARDGKSVRFRSKLEAQWALLFDTLKLSWAYEPVRFPLQGFYTYTPDFYVESIGWIEIKPRLEYLHPIMKKLQAFLAQRHTLIRDGYSNDFFTFCSQVPSLNDPCADGYTYVQWLDEKVIRGPVLPLELFYINSHGEFARSHPELVRAQLTPTFERIKYYDFARRAYRDPSTGRMEE